MRLYDEIFINNKVWAEAKLHSDPHYFDHLQLGQNPEFLYIGCSDSRVTAEDLMGAEPGEVFVHRNVANLVVPTDNNLNAVLQYAVEILKVKHIVVCGHYGCGGVKAALNPSDMGQLNSWLQTLRDVIRIHWDEIKNLEDENEKFDRMVELNVREQCLNVLKIDHVQRSYTETGFPQVHGWVFDVRSGLLRDLEMDMREEFHHIREIYELIS